MDVILTENPDEHPQWLPSWKPSKVLHLQLSDITDVENPVTATTNAMAQTDRATQTDLVENQPGIHNIIDVSRYSNLSSLLAVTGYVLRFVKNLQNCAAKTVGPLSVEERQTAQRKWIQKSQTLIYANEIANLQSNSSTHPTLVKQLCLFLDADSFLHCGGRIHNALLSDLEKFPYLLPPNHPFTALIIYRSPQKATPFWCQRDSDRTTPKLLDNLNTPVCKETSLPMHDLSEAGRNSIQSSRSCTLTH